MNQNTDPTDHTPEQRSFAFLSMPDAFRELQRSDEEAGVTRKASDAEQWSTFGQGYAAAYFRIRGVRPFDIERIEATLADIEDELKDELTRLRKLEAARQRAKNPTPPPPAPANDKPMTRLAVEFTAFLDSDEHTQRASRDEVRLEDFRLAYISAYSDATLRIMRRGTQEGMAAEIEAINAEVIAALDQLTADCAAREAQEGA
jgi:hypothetical protein